MGNDKGWGFVAYGAQVAILLAGGLSWSCKGNASDCPPATSDMGSALTAAQSAAPSVAHGSPPSPFPMASSAASAAGLKAVSVSDALEYEVTPGGYIHRSCLVHVHAGEVVLSDGTVQKGGAKRSIKRCPRSRYALVGDTLLATEANQVVTHDWVVYASTTVSPIKNMSARWVVPPGPASAEGQILYLFPGLEPGDGSQILQPVLGWQSGQWTIASWNCCPGGNEYVSDPIVVNVGDTLRGDLVGTNCANGVCQNWSVTTTDLTTNKSTALPTAVAQQMTWATGGMLEVYDVNSCDDYPGGSVPFTAISMTAVDGTGLSYSWTPTTKPSAASCRWSANAPTNPEVDISYAAAN